jgi:hypothetical protein
VIPGIYAGGFVASVLYGAPAKLPGVALGFPVLLHLERAGAVLAAVSVVSTFAHMTSLGHLPSQLGNMIGYPVADRQHELEGLIAELGRRTECRLVPLEEGKRADDEALPVIAGQLTALVRRVDAVETRPVVSAQVGGRRSTFLHVVVRVRSNGPRELAARPAQGGHGTRERERRREKRAAKRGLERGGFLRDEVLDLNAVWRSAQATPMTKLDVMATHAGPSPLERLQLLVREQAGPAREWRSKLPTLRAQSAATSALLEELARTPITPVPERGFAALVLAAPTKEWAEDVAARLGNALPSGARVDLGAPGEGLRDGQPLTGFTVRCRVSLPGVGGAKATEQVRAALANMDGLEIDYSELLDLVVVSPSG